MTSPFSQWRPAPWLPAVFSVKMMSVKSGDELRQRTPPPEHQGHCPSACPFLIVKPEMTVVVSTPV